jgi:hypothetical protein
MIVTKILYNINYALRIHKRLADQRPNNKTTPQGHKIKESAIIKCSGTVTEKSNAANYNFTSKTKRLLVHGQRL